MCGRFTLLDLADFIAMFPWVSAPEQFAPRYNIAPSQPILMLSNRQGGTLEHAIWGLIPSWARVGIEEVKPLINARYETVVHKPAFRGSFRHKRCIVPATGFYEWKRTDRARQPYYITLAGGKPMLMAGLWEDSHDGGGGEIRTACVITTPANQRISELHDRMPALLTQEQALDWIRRPDTRLDGLADLLKPYSGEMKMIPVSPIVNSPARDSRECIESITTGEDQGLFGQM